MKSECERVFGTTNISEILRKLSMPQGTFHGWIAGANIDNRALGTMMRNGADIFYILTGEKSPRAEQLQEEENVSEKRTPLAEQAGAMPDSGLHLNAAQGVVQGAGPGALATEQVAVLEAIAEVAELLTFLQRKTLRDPSYAVRAQRLIEPLASALSGEKAAG
jgi:hypothetical protein